MSQKTFFSIAAIIAVLMAGYFIYQLHAKTAVWCNANFDLECETEAVMGCEGDLAMAYNIGSWCIDGKCKGLWMIYCDGPNGIYREDDIWCENEFGTCPQGDT